MVSPIKNQGSLRKNGLYVTLLTILALCSPVSAKAQSSDMPVFFDGNERLAKPDLSTVPRLRVLMTVDFPPFSFVDQTGRLSGFHVDLVRDICAELGIEAKCQIQAMPFGDLEAALLAGDGEAVAAGITVTPALREKFAFSRPYMTIPARFAKHRAVVLTGETGAALDGRPVGVVAGTVHERMLKAFFPRIRPVSFDTQDAMLEAVKIRAVDAVFSDALRLPFWVASPASGDCCTLFGGPYLSERFLGEGLMLMARPNTPQVVAGFDYALAQLARKGRLQEIYLRYFPNGFY
ncbi:transporter substrate-binding domain-containing protein [Rhizobium sp. SGZ-381]|uniref:transporter substrate-binding domain-containing protein n=1 Tax=Rhizobium sp. SGZ-381 TaxID=3342800 RepID=UPI0036714E2A